MELLVTRPDHDDVTDFISQWFTKVLDFCIAKGIAYVDLDHDKANKKRLTAALSKQSVNPVVFNGHGGPNIITGYRKEPLIESNKDEELLEGKIVYALSCSAAMSLGECCYKKKTKTFLGYSLPFILVSDPNKGFNPLDDPLLKPILEPSNELVIALLKGHTTGEAYQQSQTSSEKWIQKLQRSDTDFYMQPLLPVLYWNKMAQKLIGDSEAKA